MDYILKSRGRGKTTDLIKRSAKTGERIITFSIASAQAINMRALNLGLEIPTAMCYNSYDGHRVGRKPESVLIDEVEYVLRNLLGYKVEAVTGTPDNMVLDIEDSEKEQTSYDEGFEDGLVTALKVFEKIGNERIS